MEDSTEVVLIDVGNSRIKSNEVKNGNINEPRIWNTIEELEHHYSNSIPFMVSSVKKISFRTKDRKYTELNLQLKLPLKVEYHTPHTLGVDRIAAAVGAYHLFPNKNCLIIDVGTCMTIDFVDEFGTYQGGIISPGLQMRMKAMSYFTDALPDISSNWQSFEESLPAKSTKGCLYNGAYQGMINEIEGFIFDFQSKFTSINIILVGGDAQFFESKLKPTIFAGSKIVEIGLYRIWKYQ